MTTQPPTDRKWRDLRECAAHFGVSRHTLYKLVRAKKIPSIKIGRVWRVDLERVERVLTRAEVPSA